MDLNALPLVETGLAVITCTAPEMREVRFKPDMTLTVQGIGEMLEARRELGKHGRHKALLVLAEEVDLQMTMITTDHYKLISSPTR